MHAEFFEGGLCTFKYECGGKNKILGAVHRVLIAGQKSRRKKGQSCKSAAVAFKLWTFNGNFLFRKHLQTKVLNPKPSRMRKQNFS